MLDSFYISSNSVEINGYASSMKGGRQENQDDMGFLDTPLGVLIIVCDGMGGGPGGKTASDIAKRSIAASISNCNELTPPDQALCDAFCNANDNLLSAVEENPSLKGMGTTTVALLISKKDAYIAHVGDSRCYLLRDSKVKWRSQDHSLVGELVQKGVMTEEQARVSNQSNVITRALGATINHTPDVEHIIYEEGDRFILCTDGVWGIMAKEQIISRFVKKINLDNLVSSLQDDIDSIGFSDGGHHDNHTLAIVDLKEDCLLSQKMKKVSKYIIAALSAFIIVLICLLISNNLKVNSYEDELASCKKELNNIKPYQQRYKDLLNNSDETTRNVYKENIELQQRIKELESRLADIENDRQDIHESETERTQTSDLPTKQASYTKPTSKKTIGGATKDELIQRAINRFDEIINCRIAKEKDNNNYQEAVQYVTKCRNEIMSLMDTLKRKDSINSPTYEAIKNNISGDNNPIIVVQLTSSGDEFVATMNSKKIAQKNKDRLKNLKK